MKKVNALNHFAVFIFVFAMLNTLTAFAGPSRTTYQAKIVKPDGYPLETSNVNFKFTILDPSATCILYSESYSSVNMSSTGGLISFSLGSGIKSFPVSSTTFEQIFSNITPNMGCDTGGGAPAVYTPLANDSRKIVMQFNDGNGWQTLPAMTINAVPYAMYANDSLKFNGLGVSDFVQLSSVPTCAASEALRYNGTMFSCIAAGGTGTVTSSTVVTALGYTPADGASVTAVSNYASSVSSTVFSVSSTVSSLANTVSGLQSSVGASFAAITSSQWLTSGTAISYSSGFVGIGTVNPVTKLDVSGGVRIGTESTSCAPALAGTLRYNASNIEYCNGTSWQAFGVSGAGITNFNGSTSGTQSFANGTGGTAPNFNTSNGVHTLNIPLASTGAVTAGLLSNADYVSFSNKITSSAASIAQVLGYVPADNAVSGTYAQKANNLSDLTNIATARSNLGLGTFATASSLDLGGASATGTLATARLPSFVGDVTSTAASNTLMLSNTGVTAGTYTKVIVDAKGRVTSGSQISNSDVTTALGYTPANSATIVSSQWATSGSAIYYNSGNVGIGTANPAAKLDINGIVKTPWSSLTAYNLGGNMNGAAAIESGANPFAITRNTGTLSLGIDNSGNVGIGTASPVGKLDVQGTAYIGATTTNAVRVEAGVIRMQDNSDAGRSLEYQGTKLSIGQNNSAAQSGNATALLNAGSVGDGTEIVRFRTNTDIGYVTMSQATVNTFNMNFVQSGTSQLYLKNDGNIGIGITNPNASSFASPGKILAVASTGGADTRAILELSGPTAGTTGTNKTGELVFTQATGGRYNSSIFGYRDGADNSQGLGFSTYSAATLSEKVRITAAGYVGIGTTTPSAKLHVAAGTSSIAALKLTSGTLLTSPQSGTVEYDGTNLYFTDSTNTRRTLAATTSAGTYDNASLISNSSGNITMYPNGGAGSVTVSATTASTNSSTGALVVKGGLGVAGTANIGGGLNVSGSSVIDGTLKLSAMTSGSVLFAGTNGVVSQDNSNFYWDDANNRLGLGINAPVSQFQMNNVTSGISVGMSLTNTDAAKDTFIRLYTKYTNITENMGSGNPSAGNKGWNVKGVGDSGASNANNLSYEFWNGSSWITPMALTSSGKVGVGTNSPLGLLQVGSGYVQAAVPFAVMAGTPGIPATSGTTQTNGSLRLGTNTSNSSVFDMGLYNAAPFGAWLQAQNGGDFSDHTLYPIALQPNGGNVGIGVANPGYKLDVSGVVRANSGGEWSIRTAFDSAVATNRNHFAALKSRAGGAVQNGDNLGGLAMGGKYDATNYSYGWNGGAEISAFASENWNATNRGADIAFLTVPNSSTAIAERMRITNSGNVGIGTANPNYKLDINEGNVRISTTNSTYTALMIANTVSGHSLTYYDAINGDFVGGDYGYVGQNNSGFMEYNIGSSSPMPYHVFSGGNVGIGTTAPAFKLTNSALTNVTDAGGMGLAGANTFVWEHPNDSSSGYVAAFLNSKTGNGTNGLLVKTTDGSTNTDILTLNSSGTDRMVVRADGNVGIGTTSPQAKLDVAGDIQSNETYYTTKIFADGWAIGDYAEVVQAAPSGAAGSSALLEVSIAGTRGNWVESSTYNLVSAHAESDVWRELTPVSVNYYTTFSYRCFTVDANGFSNVIKFRIRAIRNSGDCSASSSGQFPIVFKAHSSGHNGGWTALTATGTGATATGYRTTVGSEWNLYTGASRNAAIHTITAKEGYVGIGVSSPLQMLHVTNGAASNGDQTIAQIGSGAGSLFFTHNQPGIGSNSKYKSGWKYEDVGYASLIHFYTATGKMSFQTAPSGTAGAAATFTERMVILNDSGNVGIGVAAPTYQLQLSTDSAAKPGTSTWTIASDMRLKDSRAPFTRGINELLGLNTIYFTYKKDNPLGLPSDKEYVGIRAQDAQKVIPEAVTVDEKGFLHVTNDAIIWTVVNAVKELYHKWFTDSLRVHRELASVKAENAELKKENAEIKMRLERIEKALAEPEKSH